MRLAAGFATNRGLVRQTNEDSFFVRKGFYVVCDGMGGARAGEVASQMACESMAVIDPETAGKDELRTAIIDANERISARSLAEPRLLGMGTTLTSALIRDDRILVGHVGDSRAYLLRGGELRQLTDDHSWVGEMVRRGELTEAEAAVHPHRSVITKALGTDGQADPDLVEERLEPGDRLLLCSDGLSGMVGFAAIERILGTPGEPKAVADELVAAALEGGGEDNVTVVVIEVVAEGPERAGADPAEADAADGAGEDATGDAGEGDGGAAPVGGAAVPEGAGGATDDDQVVLGPTDRGQERSSMPGFMRPARNRAARASRRPPIWARQAPHQADVAVPKQTWFRLNHKLIITVLVIVIILALAIAAFTAFNSNVYYVGDSEGMVALYQGLPASLLGIPLSSVVEASAVSYESLPDYQRERVDAHDLVGKEEGQAFLQGLAALQ